MQAKLLIAMPTQADSISRLRGVQADLQECQQSDLSCDLIALHFFAIYYTMKEKINIVERKNKMSFAIALDGPAGAGKSSIAKRAANILNFIYVDTGALYRAIGLAALRNSVEPSPSAEVDALLEKITVELAFNENMEQIVLLDGEDVSGLIRTPEASMMASKISAVPNVRAYLLDLQRDMAVKNNVIMDGRDIGTVVLPNADVKIFLTAAPEVRAGRRYKELIEKGMDVNFEKILAEVKERDYNDSHRETAPLKPAEGCVIVDTTDLDFEQSVDEILRVIKEKL